jgi:hypothetical protein
MKRSNSQRFFPFTRNTPKSSSSTKRHRRASTSANESSPLTDSSLSKNSTEVTVSPPKKSTLSLSSLILKTAQQQAVTQKVILQDRAEVVQALSQSRQNLKELCLQKICLDDELIWLLVKSNLGWLVLGECEFDSTRSTTFAPILKFLRYGHPSKSQFRFAVQFNDHTSQWIQHTGSYDPKSTKNDPICSLLFTLPGSGPQEPFLSNISSLVVVPSKSNPMKSSSFHFNQNLRSIIGHQCPGLKHLLLKDLNFGNDIENCIPSLEMKMDLIYLWNCRFEARGLIWSALVHSLELVQSVHAREIQPFKFTILINGNTTKIVNNQTPYFSWPDSPNLRHALILFLEQSLPDNALSESISFLALLPSKMGFVKKLSSRTIDTLKLQITCQCPNLRYLLLESIVVSDMAKDFISSLQPKLDLIYIWKCDFSMIKDALWSVLNDSMHLVNSMQAEWVQAFQFAIKANGCITQIVCNKLLNFVRPYSPGLQRGLVVMLPNTLTSNLQLGNISLIVLFPPEIDVKESLLPQSKHFMKSILGLQWPNLKYLLLKCIDLDENIEEFISISRLKLDLIYFWNCDFNTKDLIWSALILSMDLVNSLHTEKARSLQFSIPINGHITQIVYNSGSSFLIPNSPDLVHGLIYSLGQHLPDDLLLDNISFLTLLPSNAEIKKPLPSQSKRSLKSMLSLPYPNLKCLLLVGINFDDKIEDYITISKLDLDIIYLWHCLFINTLDPIWSALNAFINRISSMRTEDSRHSQFTIPINGRTVQIVCDYNSLPLVPGSPDIHNGLILRLGEALPNSLLVDNINFLILLPSGSDLNKSSSSQSKQNLDSITNRSWPNLRRLFLKGMSIDSVKGMSSFIKQFDQLEVSTL